MRENDAERPLLCFTGRDPEDIVGMGHKSVGSAQRRRGGAVLQHGSILLARSPVVSRVARRLRCRGVPDRREEWDGSSRRAITAALELEIAWPSACPMRCEIARWNWKRSTYREHGLDARCDEAVGDRGPGGRPGRSDRAVDVGQPGSAQSAERTRTIVGTAKST